MLLSSRWHECHKNEEVEGYSEESRKLTRNSRVLKESSKEE